MNNNQRRFSNFDRPTLIKPTQTKPTEKSYSNMGSQSTSQEIISNSNALPISYSSAIINEPALNKLNAIIIPFISNLTRDDYVEAMAKIVNPKDICAAYRKMNDRFCIFFSSKQIVDNLLANHATISIQDNELEIRRLINPAKRIVISNVCPNIPIAVIENELKKLNIKLESPIKTLTAGFKNPLLAHILTDKKQFYIHPDSISQIPETLVINYKETLYRIFLAEDGIWCFNCKGRGHIAAQCPEKEEDDLEEVSIDGDNNENLLNEGDNQVHEVEMANTEMKSKPPPAPVKRADF